MLSSFANTTKIFQDKIKNTTMLKEVYFVRKIKQKNEQISQVFYTFTS